MRRPLVALATGAVASLVLAPVAHAGTTPATAISSEVSGEDACQEGSPSTGEDVPDTARSGVLEEHLQLARVHEQVTGKGVTVAVIDSGVQPGVLPVDEIGAKREIHDGHGTMVAGLIHEVAPDARLLSYRVVDGRPGIDEALDDEVDSEDVAAGIHTALDRGADVINLSLTTGSSAQLTSALRRAARAGALVVAAVGNRPLDDDGAPRESSAYEVGETRVAISAREPGVLGVTGLNDDGSVNPEQVMTGPGVDVSGPGQGARTVDTDGRRCLVGSGGSSWGTAVVSGVAALLLEHHTEPPALLAGRLMATAQGGQANSALDGHGMVQPLAAMTAEVEFDAQGNPVAASAVIEVPEPVTAPKPPEDLSGPRRTTLLWWGLGAGGALVGALLLRPLAVRRRPESPE